MPKQLPLNPQRRTLLLRALAGGLCIAGSRHGQLFAATAQSPMEEGQSLYQLQGEVAVNQQAATPGTVIKPDDHIRTGSRSRVIFVVGENAFLLRENSELQFTGRPQSTADSQTQERANWVDSLRLASGALLAVFGKNFRQASTSTAVAGIRGTGLYLESTPQRSYICTCYGHTQISAADDPESRIDIISQHHNARYIYAEGIHSERITKAPFINHKDSELVLLESLVGR
ncbi:MAG: hypothetical protein HQL49_11970, partial [Gammaproteobacteria bacterium]|nr:hypothetical protein [Gammaproteobacteria bacterium]